MPTIPPLQAARIREINLVFWDSLDDSLDDLDDVIAKRARLSMGKIRKSNFNPTVIKRETKKITAHTNDLTLQALAGQVEAAALYAQRAADTIRAWQISGRLKEGVEHLTVSDSAMARALRPGVSAIDAEAALSRIKVTPLKSPAAVRKALKDFGTRAPSGRLPPGNTSGTRAMKKLIKAKLVANPKAIGLSERLHGAAARNVKETEKAIGTAIREAKNMNRAGRDLIRAVNSEGSQLAVKRKLTGPLQRLKRAGRKLQGLSINSVDPDALKAATQEYNASFAQIKKIVAQRIDTRGAYLELKQQLEVKRGFRALGIKKRAFDSATKKQIDQWVSNESARRTDRALGRWLDNKQVYFSEQTIETETAAAYRSREALQHEGKPYITGWWWRRNAGMLKLDIKRRKDITKSRSRRRRGKNAKRKTKGQPCTVCPRLADNFFPMSYLREFPRGAHPNCRFWAEFVYDTSIRNGMPLTQGDLDWFEALD